MADEEKPEYFYRLVCLVVNLGTEGLRKVFEKELHGQTIQSFLKKKWKAIESLNKRNKLNQMQYDILQKGEKSEFDVSLLYVLIRNLTTLPGPIGGWDTQCPLPTDDATAAYIVKLKLIRNEAVAHSAKCCMKKSEFDKFWIEAEDALLGLARYYDEEKTMKKEIDEVKTKELIDGAKGQLDKLLKWNFEEKCAEMITQIEELNQKFAKHNSVPEDISTMKEDIRSIQKQLNYLGMYSSMEGPAGFEARAVADDGPQTSELDAMKKKMSQMESDILLRMQEVLRVYSTGKLYFMQQMDPPEPAIDNPNALKDGEIEEYSKELGRDWEIFAVHLGYRQTQIDIMKQTYPRQIETLLMNMLKKWHDVVARCDENPKKLLAAAFAGVRDNRTAFRILGDRNLVEEVRSEKPKPETEKKIQEIKFESSLACIGAPFAVNVYPGASFHNSGSISFNPTHYGAIGGSSHQNPASNICRAEGVGNNMSLNASTTTSNLYKKTEDPTLSETETNILAHYMRSVGALVIPQLGKDSCRGTVFRVGDRYVITAYHVIEPIGDEMYNQTFQAATDHYIPLVYVNFNECPTIPPKTIYQLNPPLFKDPVMDIAILEINNPDDHLPQGLPLCKFEKEFSKVSCITYGHPGSSKKHLDPNCDVFHPRSDKVRNAVKTFEERVNTIKQALWSVGKNPNLVESAFYGCSDPSGFLLNSYFEHGGSGGPAFDHSRPLDCQVVGIYLKGYPSIFFDLPEESQKSYGAEYRFEMCRKTSFLYEAISHDKEFAKNIFP